MNSLIIYKAFHRLITRKLMGLIYFFSSNSNNIFLIALSSNNSRSSYYSSNNSNMIKIKIKNYTNNCMIEKLDWLFTQQNFKSHREEFNN